MPGRFAAGLAATALVVVAAAGCSNKSGDQSGTPPTSGHREVLTQSDEAATAGTEGRPSGGGLEAGPEETPAWMDVESYVDEVRGSLPEAAVPDGFTPVSTAARASEVGYIEEFVTQLLTIDYAHQSWADTLAWVRSEGATSRDSTNPRVTADDVVVWVTKTVTDAPVSSAQLIPAEGEWERRAAAGLVQTVRNVGVVPNQRWESKVAAGQVETDDELARCMDAWASVVRTTTTPDESVVGIRPGSASLTFEICVGSAHEYQGLGFGGVGFVKEIS